MLKINKETPLRDGDIELQAIDVQQGSFVAVMGAANSGKSRLMKLLAEQSQASFTVNQSTVYKNPLDELIAFAIKNTTLTFDEAKTLISDIAQEISVTLDFNQYGYSSTDSLKFEIIKALLVKAENIFMKDVECFYNREGIALLDNLYRELDLVFIVETNNLEFVKCLATHCLFIEQYKVTECFDTNSFFTTRVVMNDGLYKFVESNTF